tara:strand:+ start:134 stop:388 length:255 start_codon:yes stop_codon:yes gene_type:complete
MFGERSKDFVTPKVVPAPVVENSSDSNVDKIKNFKTGDELVLSGVTGVDYNELNAVFADERNSGKIRFEHDQDTCTLKVIDGDG